MNEMCLNTMAAQSRDSAARGDLQKAVTGNVNGRAPVCPPDHQPSGGKDKNFFSWWPCPR